MKPIIFPQANKVLVRPDSMTDEECGTLHVFSNEGMCISLWRPSWRERLSVLFFGHVWLWVCSGPTQPPVALSGTSDIFGKVVR